jgi:hypothetical protein
VRQENLNLSGRKYIGTYKRIIADNKSCPNSERRYYFDKESKVVLYCLQYEQCAKSGSVEEWWRCWPCIPRVSGSSPSAGDFSLQPSGSPAVILVHNQCQHLSLCKDSMLCGISMQRQRENPINRHLLWPMIVIYHTSTHTSKHHPAPSIGTKVPGQQSTW